LGSLAAGGVALAGAAGHSDFLEALGYTGMLLNLFNLLPVVPLDGGRAMAAMAPWMWFLGFGAMVVLDFVSPNPVLLIITLVAGFELYRRWERRRNPTAAQSAYYTVSPRNRMIVGAVYVGLIILLALGMHFTYLHRTIS
jgi:Zn-dependent protease